jgi:hypothetical protein
MTDTPRLRPLPILLAAALAVPAVLIPLAPPDVRPWGFAAFGAIGLFAAARGGRLGLPVALALVLGGKLAFDFLNYFAAQYDARFAEMYWPFSDPAMELTLYASLALYPAIGWAALRRTANPAAVAAAALSASVLFFLVTNFASWIAQDLPYPRTPAGLLQSYQLALPFWRGTVASDLFFTAVLFGLHAALASRPAGRPVPVEVGADR